MPDLMWEHFFKNEGTWNGRFTRLLPDGTIDNHTPTQIVLSRTSDTSARFEITRYPQDTEPQQQSSNFSSINRSSIFFEDGSFSKGSMQLSPFSEFGVELSVTQPDARQRLVQIFKPGGELEYLVSIRETRDGCDPDERSQLTLEDLVGEWRGTAIAYSPSWFIADPLETQLKVSKTSTDDVLYEWNVGTETGQVSALHDGSRLLFQQGNHPYQLLLMDNGSSSLCPQIIQRHSAFLCELGWLLDSSTRIRIIRQYQSDGSWCGQLWIREQKVT